MASASTVRATAPRRALRIGKLGRLGIILAVLLALYFLLKGDYPWPSKLTYPLAAKFDEIYNWIVDNQDSNWLFVYFFNYISNFLDWLVSQLNDLLIGMTWLGVTAAGTLVTWRWGGRRVAVLVLCSFLSFGLLGLWTESMETLALMISSVLVALAIGVPVGVLAGRNDRFNAAISPILDAMQIIPAFAYLMPVVILFSVGNPAAVIATVIYATPPAVRITALGIRGVSTNAVEMAESLGATSGQVLTKVQLPLSRKAIMLALNQTIMMALGMVVIASLIGGGGLGDTVINALTYLDVGLALVAGLAIVIMAIALDRSTEAIANRTDPSRPTERMPASRARLLNVGMLVIVVAVVLVARAFGVTGYPDTITIGDYVYSTTITDPFTTHVNNAVDWVQDPNHFIYSVTSWISDHLITWGLEPLRVFLTGLPWWAVVGGTAAIAVVVSGRRPAVTAAVLIALTGVMEVWDPTMDTASQVLVATGLTLVLGIAIGILAAEMPRLERGLRPILDAMQTLPQFVYLIPVVALFNVGRVPGVIASVLYAIPVVIRLVVVGIRQVSPAAVEAAEAFGATRREVLFKVKVPLARPAIMLGVNQGIVMVLAVVIVAGLVGGGGLGYLVVVGLQRDAFGTGMVASLAILCLGIALDRITQGTTEAGRRTA